MNDALKKIPLFMRQPEKSGGFSSVPEIIDCSFRLMDRWNFDHVFNTTWMLYCSQGAGTWIECNGKRWITEPSKVYLVPAHLPFSTGLFKTGFYFSIVFNMANTLEDVQKKIYVMNSAYLLGKLPELTHARTLTRLLLLIQGIVTHYLAEIPLHDYTGGDGPLDPRVARAVRLIESHIDGSILIRDIARQLEISQITLQQIFKRDIGKTPKQFLTDMRLQHALHWLRHTDQSLDEIAQNIGMSNRCQFSGFFRRQRIIQTPPGQYRKQCLNWMREHDDQPLQIQDTTENTSVKNLPEFDWQQFKTGINMLNISILKYGLRELSTSEMVFPEGDDWQLFFPIGTYGSILCDGKTYRFSSHHVILIPGGLRFTLNHARNGRIFGVSFFVCDALKIIRNSPYIFRTHKNLLNHFPLTDLTNSACYEQIFLQNLIFSYLAMIPDQAFRHELQNLDPRILRIVKWINEHLDQKFRLAGLSQMVHMSVSSFRNLFYRELLCTPQDFLHRKRMERIQYLLLNSDLTLGKIALHVGFKNPFQLSKFFRCHRGVPPDTFRKNYRSK